MTLKRIPLPAKRQRLGKGATRWRSQAHLKHVRDHACSICGETAGVEAAHVRLGSGAGLSMKPDDWRAVALCAAGHRKQHTVGERTFWAGLDIEALIEDFIRSSPKRAEIERVRASR